MNALDLALVGIMLVSLLYGTWKGFVRDVFSLAGLIGGFFIAFRFYMIPAEWVLRWVATPLIAEIIGWTVIFLLVYLAASMLGRMVWGSLKVLRLKWFDRIAGMLFGFIKGVLLCAGILVVLVAFLPDRAPLLTGSRVAPHVIGISWELGRLVPGKLGERFREPPPSWHAVDKWSESEAEKTEPGNE